MGRRQEETGRNYQLPETEAVRISRPSPRYGLGKYFSLLRFRAEILYSGGIYREKRCENITLDLSREQLLALRNRLDEILAVPVPPIKAGLNGQRKEEKETDAEITEIFKSADENSSLPFLVEQLKEMANGKDNPEGERGNYSTPVAPEVRS